MVASYCGTFNGFIHLTVSFIQYRSGCLIKLLRYQKGKLFRKNHSVCQYCWMLNTVHFLTIVCIFSKQTFKFIINCHKSLCHIKYCKFQDYLLPSLQLDYNKDLYKPSLPINYRQYASVLTILQYNKSLFPIYNQNLKTLSCRILFPENLLKSTLLYNTWAPKIGASSL